MEAIKLQILTKLGLKAKPHVKRTLPRELVLASLSRAGEDEPEPGAGGSGLAGGSGDTTDPEEDRYTTTTVDSAPDYDDFYGRTSEIITFAEQGIPPHTPPPIMLVNLLTFIQTIHEVNCTL